MRLLAAALAVAAALALAVPAAAAGGSDLRAELVAPSGEGWQEAAAGAPGEGPVDAIQAAAEVNPPGYGRSILGTAGFEQGYERTWTQRSTNLTVVEHVYLFGNPFGAGLWLGTVKASDRDRADWQGNIDTSSIANSFGGFRNLGSSDYETVVQFVPGDRLYGVSVLGPQEEEPTALDLATQLSDSAPEEVLSSSGGGTLARIALIALGVLLAVALLAALIIVLAVRTSRRQPVLAPPAAQPPMYSPDGRWWWDGRQWQPVSPPIPPASPGP